MGSLMSSLPSSSSPKTTTKGKCIFEYIGEAPRKKISDKINTSVLIKQAQFVVRPMVSNSLGKFEHKNNFIFFYILIY